jgi:oligopeptide transport system permease protein
MAEVALGRAPRPSTMLAQAWRRLQKNKAALVSLVFITLLILTALLAPWVAPYPYDEANFLAITQAPSSAYWLGTDSLGRDVLSRLIHGARVSLTVAFVAQAMILLIGVPIGLLSGYIGGRFDLVVQRVVDVLYAFPSLLFVIIIMTFIQANLQNASGPLTQALARLNGATGGLLGVFISLGLIFWLTVARLVRGEVLKVKELEYIEAARSLGATHWSILRRHVLPNILAPIIVATTFGLPSAIMIEAGLSFLGLGVAPPTPSWGLMIAEGVRSIRSYPHIILAPGILISLTLLAFNFLGDGLRDALDPWMKR